jgi:dihydroflavonol-4-reductase
VIEPGDPVFITGATGFVGAAVVRELAARGAKVRALARPTSNLANLHGVDCEIVRGDLTDPDSLIPAMARTRYVFHVAADYRLWARDPGEIRRANLGGTLAVMAAARAIGVERIVYTSSVATLRAGHAVVDETQPLADGEGIGVYKQSKVAAERAVERLIAEGLPAIIALPSTPIGPRDIKPTPTGRILVEAANGRMPAFINTGLNLAHVEDIAAGHLLALERGRIGERYILGGQDASLKDLLVEIAGQVGRRPPRLGLPRAPFYPLAAAAEGVARISGREPFVTRDALDMAAHHMFFSSAKAERELGYSARPWPLAVADALAWFRAAGAFR